MRNYKKLINIYNKLYARFGPQRWWPAESPFEVMVGAILTQNTAWPNVEKAIDNLKKEGVLSPQKIKSAPLKRLKVLIKPSGFYNEKAQRLKEFVKFLNRRRWDSINRKSLLNIKGIGEETADSILLYALNRPVFVVDAYTKRILTRHGLVSKAAPYGEIQRFFMNSLPRRTRLFNEYHALIVEAGKNYCRKKRPLCENCPLSALTKVCIRK